MKTRLENLARGSTFQFADKKFVVLEHKDNGGTLVISPFDLENRPFDTNNSADWETSSLNEYLNGEYLEKLSAAAGKDNDAIWTHDLDLTADDGTGRKTCDCVVGLLTADEYRRNRDVMPAIDAWWWWTATRYSASNPYSMQVVRANGAWDNNYAHWGSGAVVPALNLNSNLVMDDGVEEENKAASTEDSLHDNRDEFVTALRPLLKHLHSKGYYDLTIEFRVSHNLTTLYEGSFDAE